MAGLRLVVVGGTGNVVTSVIEALAADPGGMPTPPLTESVPGGRLAELRIGVGQRP